MKLCSKKSAHWFVNIMIKNVLKLRELAEELQLPISYICSSLADNPSEYVADAAQRYGISFERDILPDEIFPDGTRIAAVVPGYPDDLRERHTLALKNAVDRYPSDIRLSVRYYHPDVTRINMFYPDDFCYVLNSLRKEDPDVYILHPLIDHHFSDYVAEIARRRPVVLFDGPVTNTELNKIGDAAYVGPDYFGCGELAVMLMADIIERSDYAVCISPFDYDSCETRKSQLSGGYMTAIRDMRYDDIDLSVFDIPIGLYRTPDHLATNISSYYTVRRERMKYKYDREDGRISGVGAVYVYNGCMDFTMQTMMSLNPTERRFFAHALFAGVNENIGELRRKYPEELVDRICLLFNSDHEKDVDSAFAVAAKRLKDGCFDRQRYFTDMKLEILNEKFNLKH